MFSTSLTRVTRQLRSPSFQEGLGKVAKMVRHWSGGTRIGGCLEAFNRDHGTLLRPGTTVFIVSDGWDTGEPDHLARQLAHIRRRADRLVWLNPLLGTPGYAALTRGLQAARPHVDLFASALDLDRLGWLPGLLRGMRR